MSFKFLSGTKFAFTLVFGSFASLTTFSVYKQWQGKRKLEEKYSDLSETEKIALEYIEKKLMEKRWREHFQVIGVLQKDD